MKQTQFKCTLLTDVILNNKSASEGPNSTLDFIPGGVFLGLVASQYDTFGADAWTIFHSGKVRFGDAHLALGNHRTLHVSASSFTPKLQSKEKMIYNHHMIDVRDENNKKLQLKQLRSGFYDYLSSSPAQAETATNFAIKSAYDSEKRRSADAKMFAYESLQKGLTFYFTIDADDVVLLDKVSSALAGTKQIGRSRSAQYGLVSISPQVFQEVTSTSVSFRDGYHTVFADSRLIFFDEYGQPTFQPSPKDLGFGEDAQINWELSQVRTFQYAPYNWKRKAFDPDRCGIEKGSVFVVEAASAPRQSKYLGAYNNEGFGKVIYNPFFLNVTSYQEILTTEQNKKGEEEINCQVQDNLLVNYLKKQRTTEVEAGLLNIVNSWITRNRNLFNRQSISFSSQWGAIRKMAESNRGNEYQTLKEEIEKYIGHGIASDRWKELGRDKVLLAFIEDIHKSYPGYEWKAVLNLSSEAAKLK